MSTETENTTNKARRGEALHALFTARPSPPPARMEDAVSRVAKVAFYGYAVGFGLLAFAFVAAMVLSALNGWWWLAVAMAVMVAVNLANLVDALEAADSERIAAPDEEG